MKQEKPIRRWVCAIAVVCLSAIAALAQTAATVAVSGVVVDPSGAAIPHATLHLHSDAADADATADNSGRFLFNVAPGTYGLTVEAAGFRTYNQAALAVAAHNAALSIKLAIAAETEEVNVPSEAAMSTDSNSNKSALVFSGDRLDQFSDDPAVMQQELSAISGSLDPSQPPQLIVDGFSNGTMPPKESIREIRINQNPFSTAYDQFGGGRIEVLTKPGMNKFHGNVSLDVVNSALNSKNPFATGAQPAYNSNYFFANLSGPIGKASSFFFSGRRNQVNGNAIINAITGPSTTFTDAVPNPSSLQNYSIRFDHQFGKTDTFIGRYTYAQSTQTNVGIGDLSLQEQGYSSRVVTNTLQSTDTHIFNTKVVLDSALQYIRTHTRQDSNSSGPTILVQGAFIGGGNSIQMLHDDLDRIEWKEDFSITNGKHFIRTGWRYRTNREANLSTANFNGQFIFPDIATYANVVANGGVGATQFSITKGQTQANVFTGDLAVYGEDEWKTTANLTLIYGLRYESQSGIPDHNDPAPRVGFAYSIPRKVKKDPFAVVRGGFGLFYQRFPASNLLNAERQNGIAEQAYFVTNPTVKPDFYTNPAGSFPDATQLNAGSPTIYQINPRLHSLMHMQGLVALEHSFGKYGNINVQYYQRRSIHGPELRNINAPLPGTYTGPGTGVRPLGGTQNIYQYSSDGISDGHTFGVNSNLNFGKRLSVWQWAGAAHQAQNIGSGGTWTFSSNSYNIRADEGPINGFSPRQLYAGADVKPGWDTAFNFFMAWRSHTYFNITTGADNNGDSIYNDRPSFATAATPAASLVQTPYGNFDLTPQPGEKIIPYNYGNAPGVVFSEMNFNKNFRFGPRPAAAAPAPGAKPDAKPGAQPDPRYRITIGIDVENVFNHTNRALPVGVLTSPDFGKSVALYSGFTGNPGANRNVAFHTAFFF